MRRIKRFKMLFVLAALAAALTGCELLSGIDGIWQEQSYLGVPDSALNMVYTLSNGHGTFTLAGLTLGDGFTFSVNGGEITVTGGADAAGEVLVDGTYDYSISGSTMTWSQAAGDIYVFSKQ